MTQPDIVIIAAALKHVDVCENNPYESIKTNILGPKNVMDAVERNCINVSVIMVSTDKACAPVNVYGMCKNIAERFIAEKSKYDEKNKYIGVRYGNVICSRGSIRQYLANGPHCPHRPGNRTRAGLDCIKRSVDS